MHHHGEVGELADDGQVVGDEEDREPLAVAEGGGDGLAGADGGAEAEPEQLAEPVPLLHEDRLVEVVAGARVPP
ncbi:hypothetical protein [Streptomyces albidoflavus]|uniref:hypothetical protein n=1 Tax=Streptomyces albidoflavus TaxID=1886 RepID=UPI00188A9E2B|nr:hypothetical protein [Streptomyces albidoflavus]MBF4133363.1 hypothetical protein [Streptomyces albidoflavus]